MRSALVLTLKFTFENKDVIAKLNALGGYAVCKQIFVYRQRFNEFPPRVSPASTTCRIGQLVVAVVTVADKVSGVNAEKASCVLSASRW